METCIGHVTHYYNRLGVAALSLSGSLKVNDTIHLFGHTTDFVQQVWSLEINHQKVLSVGPGADVALKVDEPVRSGDQVFRVTGESASGEM